MCSLQDEVGIGYIRPRIRHRSTTESRAQTGHRRRMSDACLCIERDQSQATCDLDCQITGFVGSGRADQQTGGIPAVDRHALVVDLDEVGRLTNIRAALGKYKTSVLSVLCVCTSTIGTGK